MPGGSRTLVHSIAGAPIRAIRIEVIRGPDSGKSFTAESDEVSVGTSPDSDFQLSDETVSRYHLQLRHLGERIVVEDLGSTNGTIHGKIALQKATLMSGAQLQLGTTTLRVDDGNPFAVEVHDGDDFHGLRGRSSTMRRLMAQIARVASSDASVLLLGETGVGKEVVAAALHRARGRPEAPFETVDCGALAPTLIASELFGHEKGAFTGADQRHIGAFERAHTGTLFLDEIGELPSSLQITLLGALERRSFRRVGGSKPISVDVRLVCATNRDLRTEVNAQKFREDLYYRIAVVRLEIPPLSARTQDIPLLIEHFLRQAGFEGPVTDIIPSEVVDRLVEYRWPGNVRELRNFTEAALAMGEAPHLEGSSEGSKRSAPEATEGGFPSVPISKLVERNYKEARGLVVDEFEALYLRALLERSSSNISEASRVAGIHRTYLIEMLKRHGLR